MVSIIKRMRVLKTLLNIRLGPGAAVLSGDVKRIHMVFARDIKGGHFGPRKFWHNYLPRLKYHNPAVPMTIDRHANPDGPCTMTVFFTDASSTNEPLASAQSTSGSTPASDHTPSDSSTSIDMRSKHEDTILEELFAATRAVRVEATSEEAEELRQIEEQEKSSESDRVQQEAFVAQQRRQKALLQQAKSSLEKD